MSDDEQISVYDEVEIEDMTYDETLQLYHYPCPCGDRFEIALHDLMDGEDIGVCPSCSLMIRVIFEVVSRSLSFLWGRLGRLVGLVRLYGEEWE
jgi:diphthamide biosynthesis protein 3